MADRYFPNPFSLPLDVDKSEIRSTMRWSVLAGLKVCTALSMPMLSACSARGSSIFQLCHSGPRPALSVTLSEFQSAKQIQRLFGLFYVVVACAWYLVGLSNCRRRFKSRLTPHRRQQCSYRAHVT